MIDRFEYFSASIFGISKYIQKIEREEMEKYELKGPCAQYLIAMSRFPDGVTISQLCEICDKDKSAVSRTLSELEKKNLIERVSKTDNFYRASIRLTEKGKEASQIFIEKAKTAVMLAGEGLTEENRKIFYSSLDIIANNIKKISDEGIPQN